SEKAPAKKGRLTLDGLGKLLAAMGLKTTREKSQYNFTFPAKLEEEWNMTMSAVLSTDEESIWIMAWLNELPKSAAEVPRTALLRLLAENDKMGKAFFAYMPSTKRFILERVIDNANITTESFKEDMLELARFVIDTQPVWSVSEWKQSGSTPSDSAKETKGSSEDAPGVLNGSGGAKPIKAATKDAPAGGSSSPKKR
ncbi:MAG: type III secretion system chaperone, partial [Deltaproteobacteria bacterium]